MVGERVKQSYFPEMSDSGHSGIVFDIQRCSLRDGPGIRTTLFLKGCPLQCIWCHNPESISPRLQLSWSFDRCRNCFACVEVCETGSHQVVDGVHALNHAGCQVRGACTDVCPADALEVIGKRMTVAEVMAEVEADRVYYEESGGGLTLSGGEPMFQFEFTRSLLRAAAGSGLHTCLETSGFAPWQHYEAILPWVDHILFDYKATAEAVHRELTGVSNLRILENLEALCQTGIPIVIRCPLVPGINDDPAHLKAIADLARRHPEFAGVEIMAYHAMGRDKAARIGSQAALAGKPSADEADKTRWLEEIRRAGFDGAVIG